jgi:hypothetical protein
MTSEWFRNATWDESIEGAFNEIAISSSFASSTLVDFGTAAASVSTP